MMSNKKKARNKKKAASANRAAQVAVATDLCSSSSLAKEGEWVGSSKVLVLLRSEFLSLLFIFDLQHNRIIEEKIGGISYNMSNALVVRDKSIYSIGIYMDPDKYHRIYSKNAFFKDRKFNKEEVDFFHSGTSVLDLGAKDKKWKEFTKIPSGRMEMPSLAILGHNIYAFKGSKAEVYDINRDKWENLILPPELFDIYGEPIHYPRIARHPVISDTVNNRLLVNFWYDLYAYYPNNKPESKWECLTNNKLGTQTICFLKPAQVFDDVVYFFRPKGNPYCIDAYDVTTNKRIEVSWSPEFNTDVYNDSLVELGQCGLYVIDKSFIKFIHLGDGMMCLARSSRSNDKSSTCLRFVRFRVKRLASPEEGVLITPATTHQFSLSTCYRHTGCVIPL